MKRRLRLTPQLSAEEFIVVHGLLTDELRRVNGYIREAENLSRPVALGHWRWADHGKNAEERAADRARQRIRAESHRITRDHLRSSLSKLVRL